MLHLQEPSLADLSQYIPDEVRHIGDLQIGIPRIAKDHQVMAQIHNALMRVPTRHVLVQGDSRKADFIPQGSVHLIVTSLPYWTLKQYPTNHGQLGLLQDYDQFLNELDKVWKICYRALVPGGRLVCVVGDVCIARRRNKGEHTVVPLHASLQDRYRKLGFANLAPIIWHKIANASYEVEGSSSFLGKPYEPNAVIKNDIEYILMERKPGGYRKPSPESRVLSVISEDNHRKWFQQIWEGVTGASTRSHPAPFPLELAIRLVRMFSFVGDTVLDPFMGTGTTNLAAAQWGRNSIGMEVDPDYFELARNRIIAETATLFANTTVESFNMETAHAETGEQSS